MMSTLPDATRGGQKLAVKSGWQCTAIGLISGAHHAVATDIVQCTDSAHNLPTCMVRGGHGHEGLVG
eukprot:1143560-Pelagomonas_calceolata.AAC.2